MLSLKEIYKNIYCDKFSSNVLPSEIHKDFQTFLKLLIELNKYDILDKIEFYMCGDSQYHFYKTT